MTDVLKYFGSNLHCHEITSGSNVGDISRIQMPEGMSTPQCQYAPAGMYQ